jgi:hypothetical protein
MPIDEPQGQNPIEEGSETTTTPDELCKFVLEQLRRIESPGRGRFDADPGPGPSHISAHSTLWVSIAGGGGAYDFSFGISSLFYPKRRSPNLFGVFDDPDAKGDKD